MIFMNIEHPTSNIERRRGGSWRLRSAWGALAIGLALSSVAQQTNTNSAATDNTVPTLDAFKIIQRRNIFDPNRRPYFPDRTRVPRQTANYFALTGTMSYPKGRFAFFNGTSEQYYKVLPVGGSIAGYTVTEITQTNVTLAAGGKEFQMPVGKQLRNDGQNKWQMTAHDTEEADTSETTNDDGTAAADSTTPPAGANPQMSEILKRLMQAREQELK